MIHRIIRNTTGLLEQQHLPHRGELPSLQAVEIQPRRQAMPTVIGRIPLHHIPTRALVLRHQRPHWLTHHVIHSQLHIRRLRQRILDRRRWIERVRELAAGGSIGSVGSPRITATV